MKEQDCCIVTYADRDGDIKGATRLYESIKRFNPQMHFCQFKNHQIIGAPAHKDKPYAFKYFAILEGFRRGFKNVLWLDASTWKINNGLRVFEQIEENGYFFQDSGFSLGQWSSDEFLRYWMYTREYALKINMIQGGIFGFNHEWDKKGFMIPALCQMGQDTACLDGAWTNERHQVSSDERCKGHRHDMCLTTALVKEGELKVHKQFKYYAMKEWCDKYTRCPDPEWPTSDIEYLAQGM